MGQAADLLLPRFPDERWVELSNPQHNYGQHLSIPPFHSIRLLGFCDGFTLLRGKSDFVSNQTVKICAPMLNL